MDNKNLIEKKIRLPAEVLTSEITDGVTLQSVSIKLKAIYAFQQLVRSQLKLGHDYGVIPGTPKPGLWKPGAEKIAKLLGCADKYEIIEKIEDWSKPLFSYKVKCQLVGLSSGVIISEGLGECNSMEAKYRYRWVYENQIPKHFLKEDLMIKTIKGKNGGSFTVYRIDNDDIYSQINTILKMSKKRALVDASLSAGRLSDLFTQDLVEEKIDIELLEAPTPQNGTNKPVSAPNAPEVAKDTALEPEDPENSVKPMPAPLTIVEAYQKNVGDTIMVKGILSNWEVKSVTKKDKTKAEITNYLILSEDSQYSMTITKWGGFHKEVQLGDTIVLENVVVSEFQGQKKYLAQAVSLLKAKEETI